MIKKTFCIASILFSITTGLVYSSNLTAGSEFIVNTTVAGSQFDPSISSLGNGKFVVTWTDSNQDGSNDDVYGQIFDGSSGVNPIKVGSEFCVNTHVYSSQASSCVAGMSENEFVVTWSSYGQDGTAFSVYGQQFTISGETINKTGAEFRVNTTNSSFEGESCVTNIGNGNYAVAWTGNGFVNENDIACQRFDFSAQSKLGIEFLANTITEGSQITPCIAGIGNDKLIVTWYDGEIYGRTYDAVTGNPDGTEFVINSYTTGNQQWPTVTAIGDDKYLVTWTSDGQDGDDFGVYGQLFNSTDNSPIGNEFLINSYTTGPQAGIDAAALGADKFVVTWTDEGEGQEDVADIYASIYDANTGLVLEDNFLVNSYTTDSQNSYYYSGVVSSITALSDSEFVITWYGQGQDDDSSVYARVFSYTTGDTLAVPEPASIILLIIGICGLWNRKMKK